MSTIERCRTAALGGHVAQCPHCGHSEIAYNSCSNRHCPKCQGAVAKQWLAAREPTDRDGDEVAISEGAEWA